MYGIINRNSSSGFARTPRIKRALRKYSSVDSSLSSEKSDDDDDDEFDEEDDEDDDDEEDSNNIHANMSYEFTKFMEDPTIKEGTSKNTLLGTSKAGSHELHIGMSMKIQRHTDFIHIVSEEN